MSKKAFKQNTLVSIKFVIIFFLIVDIYITLALALKFDIVDFVNNVILHTDNRVVVREVITDNS